MLIHDELKSQWSRADIVVTLASLVLLALFLRSPQAEWLPLRIAAAVSVSFAILAFVLKGVTVGGAITGAISAFLFYGVGGPSVFGLLFIAFLMTFGATKLNSKKLARKPAPRTAAQVGANLVIPNLALVWSAWDPMALISFPLLLASLAELCADTVSSEIGEAYGSSTYLITTLRRVEEGVNGGISLIGTLGGSIAALLVIGAAVLSFYPQIRQVIHFWGWSFFWSAAAGGIAGMFVDSLLGATLENRGWINNEVVNLFGTASAAGIAWLLLRVFS